MPKAKAPFSSLPSATAPNTDPSTRPGRSYFVSFPQAAKDFRPTLADQAHHARPGHRRRKVGEFLAQQMKLVASDVTAVVLKDTGPSVPQQNPKETIPPPL